MRKACLLIAVLAIAATTVRAEDIDIRELHNRLLTQEAKMAEQSAQLDDLRAKLANGGPKGGEPEGVISLQKNAVVTIGGLVTTGYYAHNVKMDSVYSYDDDGNAVKDGDGYRRRASAKESSLEISDAELYFQIDVNDYFDAFVYLDLHNTSTDNYALAKAYYVRWKNVCESGFGLKVGRDRMVFGETGYGYLDNWAVGGDGMNWIEGDYFWDYPGSVPLAEGAEGLIPRHNHSKINGVTQITPYWEGLDGKLSVELSFMQNVDNRTNARMNLGSEGSMLSRDKNGYRKYRSRNYGLGTMSTRVRWTPIEDLQFTASAVNFRSNGWGFAEGPDDGYGNDVGHKKNNTAVSLAFNYRPSFFNKLNVWGLYVKGWNVDNYDGLDSDVVNFGASFDITDSLTFFAQGDYLRSRYKFGPFDNKGTGWAFYAGAMYTLPYGVLIEAGWRHEQVKYRENGVRTAKFKGDTYYANIGFEF